MGSVHKASCPCGFNEDVFVGGTMASFGEHSTFPYYCQQCGLVSVNIAALHRASGAETTPQKRSEGASSPTCPKCGNKNVDQYGVPPASSAITKGRLALQAWSFKAFDKGNLCPACKQMTLVFRSSHVCVD